MFGLFLIIVYAVSAWFVLKQLPSRRAKTIAWAIIVLTWGPALIVAFAPPSPSQPGVEAAYIGKFVEVLLVVGLSLMPLTAIGLGIARVAAAPQSKNIVMGITVFLGFFVLFADEIAGRIYLSYLCATEAGVKVYQTVELPREYWDEEGRAKFIIREGYLDFDESMLGNHFFRKSSSQSHSSFFRINRDSYQLVDRRTQSVVGEDVNFRYWGGWVARNLSPNISATGCNRDQVGYFTDVLKKVFKPANTKE